MKFSRQGGNGTELTSSDEEAPPRLESPPGTRRRLPPSLSQSKRGSTVSKRKNRSCDRPFMHSSSRIRNNQIEAQRSGFDLGRRSDGMNER